MDELVDILDASGNATGRSLLKSEAHKKGLFHPTVHIWFYTSRGKVLIQQRSRTKDTHPLLWDVSVAGHISSGEAYTTAAIREVREEIGLDISSETLEKIGVFKSVHHHSEILIDCEFNHTYLSELKSPLEALKKQESEVEALELVPLAKFAEMTIGLTKSLKFVPHDTLYYKTVFEAIKKSM